MLAPPSAEANLVQNKLQRASSASNVSIDLKLATNNKKQRKNETSHKQQAPLCTNSARAQCDTFELELEEL